MSLLALTASEPALRAAEMIALGVVASFVGSIVGLGGGFIAIPALRLLFHLPPSLTAGTSLVLVTANVASASVEYWRQGRIDKPLGFLMGALAIPGSILGALSLRFVGPSSFDLAYAAILGIFALDLARRGIDEKRSAPSWLPWSRPRHFHDPVAAMDCEYAQSTPVAAVAGLLNGFLSSFFGIGGGVLAVPLLLRVFVLPAHIVSGTSHLIILLSAPFGVLAHVFSGDVDWLLAVPLAFGGILGGRFGAQTAKRLSTPTLARVLAAVLFIAAGSLVLQHLV